MTRASRCWTGRANSQSCIQLYRSRCSWVFIKATGNQCLVRCRECIKRTKNETKRKTVPALLFRCCELGPVFCGDTTTTRIMLASISRGPLVDMDLGKSKRTLSTRRLDATPQVSPHFVPRERDWQCRAKPNRVEHSSSQVIRQQM